MKVIAFDPAFTNIGAAVVEESVVVRAETFRVRSKSVRGVPLRGNELHAWRTTKLLADLRLFLRDYDPGEYTVLAEVPFAADGKLWSRRGRGGHGPGLTALGAGLVLGSASATGFTVELVPVGRWRPGANRAALLALLRLAPGVELKTAKGLPDEHKEDAACVAAYWLAGRDVKEA